MMLGGMCDPEPPLDNSCQPIVCEDGAQVVCQDRCVQPVRVDGQCSLTDPCAANGTCVGSATCVSSPDLPQGTGVCRPIGGFLLGQCENPDYHLNQPSDECASGLFCRSAACGSLYNMCSDPVDFGGRCDHTLPSPGEEPPCRVCEPGTECIGPEKGNGACLTRCEVDANCPCEATCDDGLCKPCSSFREECDDLHPCCDGTECRGMNGTCCKPRGEYDCETKADCCGDDRCLDLGGGKTVCAECQHTGQTCETWNDCCGGMPCRDGLCTPTCPGEGKACDVDDQVGACAKGEWVCPVGEQPICKQTIYPSAEICNGEDDDCDGKTDEDIEEAPCEEGDVLDENCQSGFSVPGTMKCVNGDAKCIARRCEASNPDDKDCYCTIGGEAVGGWGKPCGQPTGTPCIPEGSTMCTPSAWCVSEPSGTETCQSIPGCAIQNPTCWTPDDVSIPNHCYGM